MSTRHGPVRDDLLPHLRGWQKDAYHEYFRPPRRHLAAADQIQARIATIRRWAISPR